jgi:hypothetical protein
VKIFGSLSKREVSAPGGDACPQKKAGSSL